MCILLYACALCQSLDSSVRATVQRRGRHCSSSVSMPSSSSCTLCTGIHYAFFYNSAVQYSSTHLTEGRGQSRAKQGKKYTVIHLMFIVIIFLDSQADLPSNTVQYSVV